MPIFFWGIIILLAATLIFYIGFFSLIYYWHHKKATIVVVPLIFTFEFFLVAFVVVGLAVMILTYWSEILVIVQTVFKRQ